MKILVVEDEKKVAKFLQQGLEEERYAVDVARDGEQGKSLALTENYDLIILDVLLPKKDGITMLKELRVQKLNTPVLMLTAKSATEDKVEGLDSGADDYLAKPFAFAELLARVRSLLRRGAVEKSTLLKVADLHLDTVTHKAKRGDRIIELTGKEYALLEYFMRNVNRVLTRTIISEHIWNYNFDTGTNVVDVYINHLRSKIDDGFERKLLQTVRGVGYALKDE
ncbi:MAG: heavy metal response regulator transcription factor [Ignavibacteriae bacterium]|nr:heavy metal response regulator transcription factor [Ignavibacteria bacterium]MBI3364341.1 heavy metal response regulator transcription factor [Ignavibacteriota bacterium]